MRYLFVTLALLTAACGGSDTTTTQPAIEGVSTTTSSPAASTTTTAVPMATTSTTDPIETTSTTAFHIPLTDTWDTWTAILASIETGEADAWEEAEELAEGIEGAAVLWSDDYPSLNPGYWVVHRGEFESGELASASCSDIPDDMPCYPRYLGADVSPLAADGNAILIDGQALVVVDATTGERLKVFDPYFDGDGMFVGRMSLTPDATALYYGVGWEDSWYSCDASQGQVWKMDLEFGIATQIASGYNPTVSPDGRWMAVLFAEQCLPDPEQPDAWVLTPTDTVVLYDLSSGWPTEAKRWSLESRPTSYDDPNMLSWVDWRADSQFLVVVNNAGSVFEVRVDYTGPLDALPPLVEWVIGYPQALIGNTLYVTRDETPEAFGAFNLVAVDLATGSTPEIISDTVGWPYAAADTSRTRLIWGSDTQVNTAATSFGLENYLNSLAW
mgnify:CR=1 FL=1